MKKNILRSILFIAFILLFVFDGKVYAAVSNNEYETVSISNNDITIKNIAILGGNYTGDKFWVGDSLLKYNANCLISIENMSGGYQLTWEDPNYVIKDGYQEVNLLLSFPVNAVITLGITGSKPPENKDTSLNPSSVSIDSDEQQNTESLIDPSLNKSTITIKPKAKYKLKIENIPEGYTVSFVSSNKKVATVGLKGGIITGRIKGKTTIRCNITAPNGDKITLKCSVVVK